MTTSSLECSPDNGTKPLRLYFVKGWGLGDFIRRMGWRWTMRRPGVLLGCIGSSVIAKVFHSDMRHVVMACDGQVVDHQFRTTLVMDEQRFAKAYPNIIGWVDIPVRRCWSFNELNLKRRPMWLEFILSNVRYYGTLFTWGAWQGKTCLTNIYVAMKQGAGIEVPSHVWAGPVLATWLLENGYVWNILVADKATTDGGPTDTGAGPNCEGSDCADSGLSEPTESSDI